nr:OB-fold domain-containing protein [Sphingomonas sp. CDS-1]
MAGIISYGAYVPRMRLQRSAIYDANRWFAPGLKGLARGERAIANWDEDTITMAVEAARDCLHDRERGAIGTVMIASTTLPYLDRQNAGIVKEALNLADAVAALDIGGSQRAGTSMLAQALRSTGDRPVLALASEQRRARPASEGELVNGDAAAAFLIGEDDGLARFVGSHSVTADFVDHYRSSGEAYDYDWEARWVREEGHVKIGSAAIADALKAFGVSASQIAHFIVGIPGRGAGAALAKKAGITADAVRDDLAAVLGNAGTAHPLVMLAHALETARPGDMILVLGFGQGADVLLFEATSAIADAHPMLGVSGWLGRAAKEDNYLKYLSFTGELKLELGKRAEFSQRPVLTALYRNRKTVLGLVGGRCTKTGTVQFPRSEISVNQNESAIGTQEDYPLADRKASIMTFTADSLTYTPDPPNYYGMVEFEGGGRMLTEFTDADAQSIAVGAPMRMMFRIKAKDADTGFAKYFWKAVPAAGSV